MGLTGVLAPVGADIIPEHNYVIGQGGGGYRIFFDDDLVASTEDPQSVRDWILWHINRTVANASSEHLLLHAGAVQYEDIGVVLPAPMNSGKTTLVAGLVQRGLRYLTDELAALRTSDLHLVPYPKALAIEPGSFDVLSLPEWLVEDGGRQSHVTNEQLRQDSLGSECPLRAVIVPSFQPEAESRIVRINSYETFLELATNTVNLDKHRAGGVAILTGIAQRYQGFRLTMSDVDEACRLVLDTLERL
jgi:hypothetical protein